MNRRDVNGAFPPRKTIPRRAEDVMWTVVVLALGAGALTGLALARVFGWGTHCR